MLPSCHIEFVVVNVVQEHIHAGQVVGGVVDLLSKKALFDDMWLSNCFLACNNKRARAGGGVVNFIDGCLLVQGQLGNEFGDRVGG